MRDLLSLTSWMICQLLCAVAMVDSKYIDEPIRTFVKHSLIQESADESLFHAITQAANEMIVDTENS